MVWLRNIIWLTLEEFLLEGSADNEQSWHFQHLAQGSNWMLLYTAVPMGLMTMALVEMDDSMNIYTFFFFFSDFMSKIVVIWISSDLSYVFHTYAMPICAPICGPKIHNKQSCIFHVSCILENS